jgi:regulatory protein
LKITSIIKQKNNDERYNIFVDNTFCFSASTEDLVKNSLQTDTEIDNCKLEQIIETCEYTKAFKYSLKLIEMKDYTIHEIRNKLTLKSYSEQTIEKVVGKLEELGFLNDNKFSERYLHDSLLIKKHGIKKIAYNLKQKGISQEKIDSIEVNYDIQYDNAYILAAKKYKQLEGKINIKEKIFRFLVTKGYDFDIAKKVCEKILNNDEEFENI